MKSTAIAFDFDGTLIQVWLDKGVHIMYSSWFSCAECGLGEILRPDDLGRDVDRMVRAYLAYPGAPRFQQLAAIVNSLANDAPKAVSDPVDFGLRGELTARYPSVRDRYNEVYSRLNNIAAERYWGVYPSAKATLKELARDHDLYVTSGVTEDILQEDFDKHGFDRALFQGVWGANPSGGADKAALLRSIRDKGYEDVLFVGDSNQDQDYALTAGVNFFRIKDNDSYGELLGQVRDGKLPHQPEPWDYTPEQVEFLRVKTHKPLLTYTTGNPMELEAISDWIHE